MGRLATAINLADERKLAAIGEENGHEPSINFTTESQTRRVISGFDIEYDELRSLAMQAGAFFSALALQMSLSHTHEAAWTEGLLVGLFAASLSSEVSDMEVTGPEGIE